MSDDSLQPNADMDDFFEPGCIQVHQGVPEPQLHGSLIDEAVERIRERKEPVALVPATDTLTGRPVVMIGFVSPSPKSSDPNDVAISPWAVLLKQDELDRYDMGSPLQDVEPAAPRPDKLSSIPASDIEAVLGDLFSRILEQSEPHTGSPERKLNPGAAWPFGKKE